MLLLLISLIEGGALDALRDVKKQYQRNNKLFDKTIDEMPVFGTIASQFNDSGTSRLFKDIVNRLTDQKLFRFSKSNLKIPLNEKICIIPQNRIRYLSEISEENRKYNKWVEKQQKIASSIYNLESSINYFDKKNDKDIIKKIKLKLIEIEGELDSENNDLLKTWSSLSKDYSEQFFEFKVRNKKLRIKTLQSHCLD